MKKIVCFSADILFVDVNVGYLEVKCGSDDLHLRGCWAFIRCSAKLSNPRRLSKHAPSVEGSGNCVTAMGVSILRWMRVTELKLDELELSGVPPVSSLREDAEVATPNFADKCSRLGREDNRKPRRPGQVEGWWVCLRASRTRSTAVPLNSTQQVTTEEIGTATRKTYTQVRDQASSLDTHPIALRPSFTWSHGGSSRGFRYRSSFRA